MRLYIFANSNDHVCWSNLEGTFLKNVGLAVCYVFPYSQISWTSFNYTVICYFLFHRNATITKQILDIMSRQLFSCSQELPKCGSPEMCAESRLIALLFEKGLGINATDVYVKCKVVRWLNHTFAGFLRNFGTSLAMMNLIHHFHIGRRILFMRNVNMKSLRLERLIRSLLAIWNEMYWI